MRHDNPNLPNHFGGFRTQELLPKPWWKSCSSPAHKNRPWSFESFKIRLNSENSHAEHAFTLPELRPHGERPGLRDFQWGWVNHFRRDWRETYLHDFEIAFFLNESERSLSSCSSWKFCKMAVISFTNCCLSEFARGQGDTVPAHRWITGAGAQPGRRFRFVNRVSEKQLKRQT